MPITENRRAAVDNATANLVDSFEARTSQTQPGLFSLGCAGHPGAGSSRAQLWREN